MFRDAGRSRAGEWYVRAALVEGFGAGGERSRGCVVVRCAARGGMGNHVTRGGVAW